MSIVSVSIKYIICNLDPWLIVREHFGVMEVGGCTHHWQLLRLVNSCQGSLPSKTALETKNKAVTSADLFWSANSKSPVLNLLHVKLTVCRDTLLSGLGIDNIKLRADTAPVLRCSSLQPQRLKFNAFSCYIFNSNLQVLCMLV